MAVHDAGSNGGLVAASKSHARMLTEDGETSRTQRLKMRSLVILQPTPQLPVGVPSRHGRAFCETLPALVCEKARARRPVSSPTLDPLSRGVFPWTETKWTNSTSAT